MSVLETKRKMTSREQTAYDLGFHEGRNGVVPVVRCRDCKHQIERGYAQYRFKWCEVWRRINGMGDDGFCNYGERKDENV